MRDNEPIGTITLQGVWSSGPGYSGTVTREVRLFASHVEHWSIEGIEDEGGDLELLGRSSEGGWRSALSLVFSEPEIPLGMGTRVTGPENVSLDLFRLAWGTEAEKRLARDLIELSDSQLQIV